MSCSSANISSPLPTALQFTPPCVNDVNNRFADPPPIGWMVFSRLPARPGFMLLRSGINNPGFFELFGFVDGRFIGNPSLKPKDLRAGKQGSRHSSRQ